MHLLSKDKMKLFAWSLKAFGKYKTGFTFEIVGVIYNLLLKEQ